MKHTIPTVLLCLIAACGERVESPAPAPTAATSAPTLGDATMAKWSRSCALCHVDGTGGAPRLGVAEEWSVRLAQGEDALLAHTIEGYNNMPPLGYCMSCSGDELRALIRFMSGASGGPGARS